MVIADQTEPADIVDRLLWRDAQDMLARHAGSDHAGLCVWCGGQWPCAPRRVAERADTVSRRPWREAWTLRHDLNSIRAMPGADGTRRRATVRRRGRNERRNTGTGGNRGYFD